jgi:hypothetical protein
MPHQGALRDITAGDLILHFKDRFTQDISVIREHLEDRKWIKEGSTDILDNIQVLIGPTIPTNARWAVRIVDAGGNTRTNEWLTTRARVETYKLYFDCMLRAGANRTEIDLAIQDFSSIVTNYLLSIKRLGFVIQSLPTGVPNVPIYDSWVDSVDTGYTKNGAYRIARISWWGKLVNVYNELGIVSIV